MPDVDLPKTLVVWLNIMSIGQNLMGRQYGFKVFDIFLTKVFIWFPLDGRTCEKQFFD